MISIRLRLLRLLIGPILLINLAGASLTYLLAWMPAQLAFDQTLMDAAIAVASRLRLDQQEAVLDMPRQAEQVLRADNLDELFFVVRSPDGKVLAGDADFPALLIVGAQAYDDRMRGEQVRVAAVRATTGGVTVHVGIAKTLRKRMQLRSAIVRALILMESLFTLALVGLIWFSVTNGLLPLERLRTILGTREADQLEPIDGAAVPYELSPVVTAINDLLDKVQRGARAQHDFLADVAHQLRTPLAGVKLQLEFLALRHGADPETVRAVQMMLSSNERMIRQTNQLLALARAEPARFEKKRLETLDLAGLVSQVVQYFVDEAGKKKIDIGFELEPAMVAGDGFLLRDLIDNLTDNAVRYTPVQGTVTVRCRQAGRQGVFEIEDSGPGIPAHLRGAVFERYTRLDENSSGSGLGLAIVRDIAAAHGATVSIDDGPQGRGMLISVHFPPLE